jgi:Uma2 family endonuclease
MTAQQFLAWEERQELRYEFDGSQPVAMTGATIAHAGIEMNLNMALGNRLRGKPCRACPSDVKISVAGRIRYPDGFVTCTPIAARSTVVTAPVVVFEVWSESTANTDLIVKNAEYRATPSIRHYVILQQTHASALVFARKGEDWVAETLSGDGAVLRMSEIGIEVPLAELYLDVELVGEADEAEA